MRTMILYLQIMSLKNQFCLSVTKIFKTATCAHNNHSLVRWFIIVEKMWLGFGDGCLPTFHPHNQPMTYIQLKCSSAGRDVGVLNAKTEKFSGELNFPVQCIKPKLCWQFHCWWCDVFLITLFTILFVNLLQCEKAAGKAWKILSRE